MMRLTLGAVAAAFMVAAVFAGINASTPAKRERRMVYALAAAGFGMCMLVFALMADWVGK